MKKLITNYTFNKTAKTIIFNDYTSINLEGLLMITNISNLNKPVLYQFNNLALTASIVGNVVTLGYDTTSMSNSDVLQIFYDDVDENNRSSEEAMLLRKIIRLLDSNAVVDIQNRQKIAVEVMPTVAVSGSLTTAGSVSTVTTLSQLSGVDAKQQLIDTARTAYALLRNQITFN